MTMTPGGDPPPPSCQMGYRLGMCACADHQTGSCLATSPIPYSKVGGGKASKSNLRGVVGFTGTSSLGSPVGAIVIVCQVQLLAAMDTQFGAHVQAKPRRQRMFPCYVRWGWGRRASLSFFKSITTSTTTTTPSLPPTGTL